MSDLTTRSCDQKARARLPTKDGQRARLGYVDTGWRFFDILAVTSRQLQKGAKSGHGSSRYLEIVPTIYFQAQDANEYNEPMTLYRSNLITVFSTLHPSFNTLVCLRALHVVEALVVA